MIQSGYVAYIWKSTEKRAQRSMLWWAFPERGVCDIIAALCGPV